MINRVVFFFCVCFLIDMFSIIFMMCVFFNALHQEKTASGKTRSDLMKNKRNKVVSKKQNAAGKKAYANISTWTSSVLANLWYP